MTKLWRWFRWRSMLLAMAFMVGFLGFQLGAGVSDRMGVEDAGIWTHVYYTLGLFVLGGMDLGVPRGGSNLALSLLWTAYFLCPIITLSAVIEAIVRTLNPQAWALRRIKGHVVIGGAGRLTMLYLARLRAESPNTPVVIVESRADLLDAVDVEKHFGAYLVKGDISSHAVLESLNLNRARRLMLLTGNDFTNMEAASKIGAEWPELAPDTVLHVSDITMLRLLNKSGVLSRSQIFNSHHIAARHLVTTRMLEHFDRTEPADLVVIAGFGRFGQTILAELQEHAIGTFKTVIVMDTRAKFHTAVFDEQVGFKGGYRLEIIEGDMADPNVWERAEAHFDPGIKEPVFVLGSNDDGNNLRVALWLMNKHPEAYTVALSFRQSTFATQISGACNFDVVSAEDLVVDSMPGAWFKASNRSIWHGSPLAIAQAAAPTPPDDAA